jgi:hypothetical protein
MSPNPAREPGIIEPFGGARVRPLRITMSMSKPVTGDLLQTGSYVAVLEGFGLTKSSVIRVVGPSALSVLLWLCSHGYEQVGYVGAAGNCTHEEPDALIVAHTCDEIELKHFLQVTRQVRPGGVLVFQLRADPNRSLGGVEWMMNDAGFTTICRMDRGRRTLIIARRHHSPMRKAA